MNEPIYPLFINNVQMGWYETTGARKFALDVYVGGRNIKRVLDRGKALYVWIDDEDEDYENEEEIDY